MRSPIQNIVFDLGGVIMEIDFRKTHAAFDALGAEAFTEVFSKLKQDPLIDSFEEGKLMASEFRAILCERLKIQSLSDEAFDRAWGAMLVSFPPARLALLRELGTRFHLYLFSNTNEIHYGQVASVYKKEQNESFSKFNQLFRKAYYSHLFGRRKPHVESFEALLKENQLNPEETLFVDDTAHHLEGAKQAGLQTFHIQGSHDIFEAVRLLSLTISSRIPHPKGI